MDEKSEDKSSIDIGELISRLDYEYEMTKQPTSIVATLCSFHLVIVLIIIAVFVVLAYKGCA